VAEDDVRVPAGWYPDPLGLPQLRWWDNHAWTEHVSDARQPVMQEATLAPTATVTAVYADDEIDDPVPDFSHYEGFSSRRERREFERGYDPEDEIAESDVDPGTPSVIAETAVLFDDPQLSLEAPQRDQRDLGLESPGARLLRDGNPIDAPTSAPYDLDLRFDDLLGDESETLEPAAAPRAAYSHLGDHAAQFVPQMEEERRPIGDPTPTHSMTALGDPVVSTGPVWILALTPLIMLMLGMLFLLSGAAGPASAAFIVVVLAVPYAMGVVLAMLDRTQLQRAGHRETAHWGWAFLSIPVYLLVRLAAVVRETGRGFGPILTWSALTVFVLGAILAVPGLVLALAPAQFAQEAEASVRYDASLRGATGIEVSCPEVPPMLVQQQFTCQGHTERAGDFLITVSLQRANGWIEWRVDDWGVGSMES